MSQSLSVDPFQVETAAELIMGAARTAAPKIIVCSVFIVFLFLGGN
jgi:hypothetical protein